ncbi:MAG: class I SAM-dependent methyltransferase [Thermoplasmata archaeon]
MSQNSNPSGFLGRLHARGMAWGHRHFYRNTARVLDLGEEDRFLEIGFGSGIFIRKHASHVSRVAGLDISEDMVRLADSINCDLVESGRAEFRQGDVTSLPWNGGEFSAVTGIETFFFWPEPVKALMEIRRVLVPGGRLVLEMAFNKEDGRDHSKEIKKMGLKQYSAEEMRTMLVEAGFSDIVFDYYKCIWVPFKGYVVPKGMIVMAIKTKE